ncbi:hypothetical protein JW613_34190 [Streptomyces smyrnaeus]|uniref:Integral membrane protein n=1 Tax=Streptomyces smyrnaeus TaxID=1387713 RepID=A0ABS3Y6Q1_9ACTN|nr:hypothetical protein [Streptomyces smyrnaeus]MBO8203296.1 hypothetical protein [Streptomyces smyrnaeus]
MATESTKTTQTTTEKSPADEPADEAVAAEETPARPADGLRGKEAADAHADNADADNAADADDNADDSYDGDGDDEAGLDAQGRAAGRRSDWAGGAFAVVSAGLGLASLTGTSFSEMLRERKSLLGQIKSNAQGSGGSAADQVNALYGAPWHTAAVVNGIFAVLALVVGGLLLATLSGRPEARGWVKAVALGGVVLGLIGLVVAGGMYFDLFAAQPEVPSAGQ